jgi:hypothetical protein
MSITGGALTILNEFNDPPEDLVGLTGHECAPARSLASVPAAPGCNAILKDVVFPTTFRAASFVRSGMPAGRALLGRFLPCVAQLCKLPYRRFATGVALGKPRADHRLVSRPPIENRRYSRIKSCATLRGWSRSASLRNVRVTRQCPVRSGAELHRRSRSS